MAKSDTTKPNDSHATVRHELQTENDASVEAVLALITSDGWAPVTSKPGVTVFRKFVLPPSHVIPSSAISCGDDGRETVAQGG